MLTQAWTTSALAVVLLLGIPTSGRAQSYAERRVRSHVAVGQTARLSGHVNFRGACAVVVQTALSVQTPPQHGTLDVRDEVVTSTHPELGRRRCGGQAGQGKVVYYTRTTRGTDRFDYQSSSENGVVHVTATVD